MSTHEVLRNVGLILAAGLVAAPLAAMLRLPIMIVLLALGVLLGPSGAGWVDNPVGGLGAQLIFTLGVSLILFHGGLRVSLRVISRTAISLSALAIPGIVITSFVVALVVAPLFDVSFRVAFLIGAVLAATDPATLIPLFDRLPLRRKVAQTVVAESAFNDPTGTILVLAVAGTAGSVSLGSTATDFGKSLVLGCLFGLAAGAVVVVVTSSGRSGVWRESPAAVALGIVALMYFTTDRVGGSAYLGAFVMGLVVSNVGRGGPPREHRMLLDGFVAQMAEVATLAVFITLGINLPLERLWHDFWPGLGVVAALVFLARPLAVAACLLPDRRARWTRKEVLFVIWCRETGVVPAALASLLLAEGVSGAKIAVSVVALAICATLLLQATTAGYVAKRLGLLDEISVVPEAR
jgi:potassium/hydrogen antiporter